MSQASYFEFHHVSKLFGKQTALRDVSFRIGAGEKIFIVGPNGGGKSTLIKIMMGIMQATSGDVQHQPVQVGYLPQTTTNKDRHFPATVQEIIRMGLPKTKMFSKPTAREQAHIDHCVKQLHIESIQHQRIGLLSGGQAQRVLLARAMVANPDVLILDEPTSALDPTMREEFYPLIQSIHEQGTTVIIVSHDVASHTDNASRIIYLDQTILFDGTFAAFCETESLSPFIHTHASHGDHT
jgi:zinc transport system ATP-binding protein